MRRKNARLRARVLISGGCGLFAHISVAQRCYSSSKTRPRKSAHRGPGAVRTHSRSGYSHARRVKRRSERTAATFSPKAPDGPLLSAACRADSAEGTIGGVKEGVFFFLFFLLLRFSLKVGEEVTTELLLVSDPCLCLTCLVYGFFGGEEGEVGNECRGRAFRRRWSSASWRAVCFSVKNLGIKKREELKVFQCYVQKKRLSLSVGETLVRGTPTLIHLSALAVLKRRRFPTWGRNQTFLRTPSFEKCQKSRGLSVTACNNGKYVLHYWCSLHLWMWNMSHYGIGITPFFFYNFSAGLSSALNGPARELNKSYEHSISHTGLLQISYWLDMFLYFDLKVTLFCACCDLFCPLLFVLDDH